MSRLIALLALALLLAGCGGSAPPVVQDVQGEELELPPPPPDLPGW